MGMSRWGVDEFVSCTEECSFVVEAFNLGFVAQLIGGGVDMAATTGFNGVLDNKSVIKVQ